jgi:hypothetical protein
MNKLTSRQQSHRPQACSITCLLLLLARSQLGRGKLWCITLIQWMVY